MTKGKTRLRVLLFCKRADCLVAKLTSDSVLRVSFLGYLRLIKRNLNLERLSTNIVSEVYRPILGRHIGRVSTEYRSTEAFISYDPKRFLL